MGFTISAVDEEPRTGGFTIAPAEPQSIREQAWSGAKTGFKYGGPLGGLIGTIPAASRALDEAAYDVGGRVTDMASGAGLPPEVAAGAGFATNVGMQAIPAVVGGGGAGKVVAPAIEGAAKGLMTSALKPSAEASRTGRAATAIQTMLDEGINATKGGVEVLKGRIAALNDEIASRIQNSNEIVDKNAVWAPIKETLDKFTRQVNPNADIGKIRAAWNEFVNHPLITGDTMPVQLAQELKQGTYKVLSGKYGEIGSAESEAQKALARGLKEQVAQAVPEIAGLNARESKLLSALSVTERRVLAEANKNPMGISLLSAHPAAWAAFMADRSSAFKSIVARMLNAGQERIPQAVVGSGIAEGQTINDLMGRSKP